MLFNSYEFIFLFLPLTLGLYFLLAKFGREAAIKMLVVASLFFYGWWNPIYLFLILASMVGNFVFGEMIAAFRIGREGRAKFLTVSGILLNLVALAYFKYAAFLVENINNVAGTGFDVGTIVLPLAISFFTFQQIAYLVDAYRGVTKEYSFSHYALFVTFFPQLIAGPIVHHKDMLPQFMRRDALAPKLENICVGLTIFAIGLFKKSVLADSVAQYSTPIFDAAQAGATLTFLEAWGGALSYTMQLYFDFSGYSDMAIGGARLFGVKLPLNFHSPYKAISISEFWRRWHMTLSRFLRDYLYIAIGGNRKGYVRRYTNLFVTMLLGGLWHGAGWTFVVWGGLHGFYLVINHAWSAFMKKKWPERKTPGRLYKLFAWSLTFVAVVVGWVFFRAESFDAAVNVLSGMAGVNGFALPNGLAVRLGAGWDILHELGWVTYLGGGTTFVFTWLWLIFLFPIAVIMPNSQQILSKYEPALASSEMDAKGELQMFPAYADKIRWNPSFQWALIFGVVAGIGVLALTRISEFLYFQF